MQEEKLGRKQVTLLIGESLPFRVGLELGVASEFNFLALEKEQVKCPRQEREFLASYISMYSSTRV